ncbi:MAG: radical SAM protein [Methanoregulaceae archaeon]|jgi:wyosine [tRNA(Phe)-imidazoG37] synthetase (radical SAM superfamily)|nr:radical SAM protein [Methanoregulaceae archaeon]MCU0628781.1 radical SAM protein [Methanoregulaceae archaeon]
MQYSHLFGPVHSRRLGRSLGIDLVPVKTCSFDCVYCECGHTTLETIKRQEFFPLKEVLSEIQNYLCRSPELDFITFSGSGEPTLSTSIGEVIRFLKHSFPHYRVAVLTNGSLLWHPDVRCDLLLADVVLPTLSSVFESTFRKIQRPAPGISVAQVLEGLERFREEYIGEIWLEVFIIPGINTSQLEMDGLRAAIERIRPDRVQLNTLDRPGTEEWVRPASPEELERIRGVLGLSGVNAVEPVRYELSAGATMTGEWSDAVARVHDLIKRRPCTLDDISASTGLSRREILKILREIQITSVIEEKREERGIFFFCPE